jgi:hypothetical protein
VSVGSRTLRQETLRDFARAERPAVWAPGSRERRGAVKRRCEGFAEAAERRVSVRQPCATGEPGRFRVRSRAALEVPLAEFLVWMSHALGEAMDRWVRSG